MIEKNRNTQLMYVRLGLMVLFSSNLGCSILFDQNSPDDLEAADAAAQSDATAAPCTEGNAQAQNSLNNTCYSLHTDQMSWYNAREACTALDGTLAIITSETENNTIGTLVFKLSTEAWVGASEGANDGDVPQEPPFRWLDGSDLKNYSNWSLGTPPSENQSEDCMIMQTSGHWDDRVCSDLFAYICEREL